MKPGDMIEWVDKTSTLVHKREELWSSVMYKWVPVGGTTHLLIALNDDNLTWLNDKGLFHARVDDTGGRLGGARIGTVVPRARG